jgi:hypothetical protein
VRGREGAGGAPHLIVELRVPQQWCCTCTVDGGRRRRACCAEGQASMRSASRAIDRQVTLHTHRAPPPAPPVCVPTSTGHPPLREPYDEVMGVGLAGGIHHILESGGPDAKGDVVQNACAKQDRLLTHQLYSGGEEGWEGAGGAGCRGCKGWATWGSCPSCQHMRCPCKASDTSAMVESRRDRGRGEVGACACVSAGASTGSPSTHPNVGSQPVGI